ncbi:MAG: REP element-mobilizing transposase RayT [Cyclobacteriaceae bacterium]|jgi:putative transposase
MDHFAAPRKSSLKVDTIYFWTATIRRWQNLLRNDHYKKVITDSLQQLSDRQLIHVYAFVIMPNHIHLIWKLKQMNGSELPSASLLKFTAHQFKKMLPSDQLSSYQVDAGNKAYEFWQRDSLGIELYTPDVAYQKLEYLHLNPMGTKWNLVIDPCDYEFSSAAFYEKKASPFTFLKHIGEEF